MCNFDGFLIIGYGGKQVVIQKKTDPTPNSEIRMYWNFYTEKKKKPGQSFANFSVSSYFIRTYVYNSLSTLKTKVRTRSGYSWDQSKMSKSSRFMGTIYCIVVWTNLYHRCPKLIWSPERACYEFVTSISKPFDFITFTKTNAPYWLTPFSISKSFKFCDILNALRLFYSVGTRQLTAKAKLTPRNAHQIKWMLIIIKISAIIYHVRLNYRRTR